MIKNSKTLDESQDHISVYFNANIKNNTNNSITADYNETRTASIIRKPDEYCMAITRFSIPCQSIPIFIFQDNFYSVTIYDKNTATAYREFVPYIDLNPNDPEQTVFFYQHMLDMINTALETANTAQGGGFAAPRFIFEDQLFKLILPTAEYRDDNATGLELWVNSEVSNLFSIYGAFTGFNQVDGMDFRFIVNPVLDNQYPLDANFTILSNEYPLFSTWYDIADIVITSNLIPMVKENISFVNSLLENQSNAIKLSILTDFVPYFQIGSDNKDRYLYNADQLRYIDLLSNSSLNKIDFKVYWLSKRGVLNNINILPGEELNIKFLFRKKDYLT
jgi:hypothetical protein